MKNNISNYLIYLDNIICKIPKIEKVLLSELINSSYNLVNSKNILVEIQYLDYLFCLMLEMKYINYKTYLTLGGYLEKIILGFKVR